MSKKIVFTLLDQPVSERKELSINGIIKKFPQRKFTDHKIFKKVFSAGLSPNEVQSVDEHKSQRKDVNGNLITLNGLHRISFIFDEQSHINGSQNLNQNNQNKKNSKLINYAQNKSQLIIA